MRRMACGLWPILVLEMIVVGSVQADEVLPVGEASKAIEFPHFPDRMHAFVWRNWETADLSRMAAVLGTDEEKVRAIGASMGLPPHQPISGLQADRGYISVIRRNWHLLNYDQLLTLLGWDAEKLGYTLKEDDFLWVKLGHRKPQCEPLRYETPAPAARARAAEIKRIVEADFGPLLRTEAEPRFAFVERLTDPAGVPDAPPPGENEPIRFLYSYFAVYGDPLLRPELDPYPDGLLKRLANQGVNGVWLHTVLRQLAPSRHFPEFGEDHERRLETLRAMVQRAKRYGIRIYLYMNEPRSMSPAFFEKYPDLAGAKENIQVAMCTSVPETLAFVRESLAYVFENVPDLGGVFAITASENLTNCWSRGTQDHCPRCRDRDPAMVVAEVNQAIAEGVRAGNPDATVICWDWGWRDDWVEKIIANLPDDVYLMSVSEWSLPIERGGVRNKVGEYSISAVGPGPRATQHWKWARDRGLKTIAKVQVNCTWECSAVPYLPAMNLVAQHLENLSRAGIDGQMLSWSLGGYPSPNLQLVSRFGLEPGTEAEDALRHVAIERFGKRAAHHAQAAWAVCSKAFTEYPFDVRVIYGGPCQVGPANPLYIDPTGYGATMVGIPYDDLDTWRGPYPPEVFANQFEKLAMIWTMGLGMFERAVSDAESDVYRAHAEEDLRLATAAYTHFASVANQAQFVIARNALAGLSDVKERNARLELMISVAEEEIGLARQLFELAREDSRIGYEASNHYYYYPTDLIEKVVNCRHVIAVCNERLQPL